MVVALTEPARVCLQLRQQRVMFHKRMVEVDKQPVSIESNADLCRLQASYASISNLLLRLAKVPQAPSGAQSASQPERPQLDITPEAIPQEAPGASPSDDAPQGGSERDEPI